MSNKSKLPPKLSHANQQQVTVTQQYSGPLPPASQIGEMAEHYPDAPKIIFEQFQLEGESRRAGQALLIENQRFELETQRIAVEADAHITKILSYGALATVILLIIGGVALIAMDKQASGLTSICGAAGLIIWGRYRSDEKSK